MDSTRWERIREIFLEAQDVPGEERELLLTRLCAGDEDIRVQVERMLATLEESGFFLEAPGEATLPGGLEGRRLDDFLIEEEIGRGGMGVVYRARQLGLDREVAVKVLGTGLLTTRTDLERFHREARATAKLRHPALVTIHSDGSAGGLHYFAMEYVEGRDLAAEMRRGSDEDSLLPPREDPEHVPKVCRLIAEVAEALEVAHEAGIIHRDIKPHNLLLSQDGQLKVVDFGLAVEEAGAILTRTGDVGGTPYYMSPEQARAARHEVDRRTDVYSLGVVLYELLSGKRPIEGKDSREVISRIATEEPYSVRKWNPLISKDLDAICRMAMAKEREERYATSAEFATDLRRLLALQPVKAREDNLRLSIRRWTRLHRSTLRWVAAALLLTLGGLQALSWSRTQDARAQAGDLFDEVLGWENWGAERDGEIIRARLLAEELAAGGAGASPGNDGRAERFLERLDREVSHLVDTALSRLSQSFLPGRSRQRWSRVDEAALAAGLRMIDRASLLFPGHESLSNVEKTDYFRFRVNLTAIDEEEPDAAFHGGYREVSPLGDLGPYNDLGSAPWDPIVLPTGLYRFIVQHEDGRLRELNRRVGHLTAGIDVSCRFRADQDTQRMILVSGGVMSLPTDELRGCCNEGRTLTIEPFYADEAEVSMAEYRTFCEVTGKALPYTWQHLPEGDWDDYPAVGVAGLDAIAYAEWVGKRLLTHAEWEFLACPTGDHFPDWPDEGEDYRGAVHGPPGFADLVVSIRDGFTTYCLPVRDPSALDANGFYHLLGNATEWTESPGFSEDQDQEYFGSLDSRVLMGCGWSAKAKDYTLRTHFISTPDWSTVFVTGGFRCALSLTP